MAGFAWGGYKALHPLCCSQMEVIVGEFGIVVVPRDGADPERIMNHSSILRKYKVSGWVHVWPGEAVRGLAVSLHRGGDTFVVGHKRSQAQVLSADGWDEQGGEAGEAHTCSQGIPSLLFSSFSCRTTSWW